MNHGSEPREVRARVPTRLTDREGRGMLFGDPSSPGRDRVRRSDLGPRSIDGKAVLLAGRAAVDVPGSGSRLKSRRPNYPTLTYIHRKPARTGRSAGLHARRGARDEGHIATGLGEPSRLVLGCTADVRCIMKTEVLRLREGGENL